MILILLEIQQWFKLDIMIMVEVWIMHSAWLEYLYPQCARGVFHNSESVDNEKDADNRFQVTVNLLASWSENNTTNTKYIAPIASHVSAWHRIGLIMCYHREEGKLSRIAVCRVFWTLSIDAQFLPV